MNIPLLNPDDMDTLYKGISQKIEGKINNLTQIIPIFIEKYSSCHLLEQNKKYPKYLNRLINRFQFRLSELLEKCKQQEQLDYIIELQRMLETQNFSLFLQRIQQRLSSENRVNEIVPLKQNTSSWQMNNKNNKCLFQFYEDQFWNLYGILMLNEQIFLKIFREYIESLILYYQSKQENVERLFKLSLERNKQFNYIQQQKYPELSLLAKISQRIDYLQMNCTLENPNNLGTVAYGTLTPNHKFQLNAHSTSPKKNVRALVYIKDNNNISSYPRRIRHYSQNNTNYFPFSNQTLIEKSEIQANQSPTPTKPQTSSGYKKINQIDLNCNSNKQIQNRLIDFCNLLQLLQNGATKNLKQINPQIQHFINSYFLPREQIIEDYLQ